MSTPTTRETLLKAIADTGGTWLSSYSEELQAQMLQGYIRNIDEFRAEYQRRFREYPDPFALLKEYPHRAKAFFHHDTLHTSSEIKIMIWRILFGCEIKRIHLDYNSEGDTELTFWVQQPPDGDEEKYVGVP
ncbi:MAG TPA: hypothetical protein VGZ22_09610, partial [Isosphaeraceae bacterium]|nr:hypothetical protein [Isosphaeraceae bacterium]